jgi:hypothetical protein
MFARRWNPRSTARRGSRGEVSRPVASISSPGLAVEPALLVRGNLGAAFGVSKGEARFVNLSHILATPALSPSCRREQIRQNAQELRVGR